MAIRRLKTTNRAVEAFYEKALPLVEEWNAKRSAHTPLLRLEIAPVRRRARKKKVMLKSVLGTFGLTEVLFTLYVIEADPTTSRLYGTMVLLGKKRPATLATFVELLADLKQLL